MSKPTLTGSITLTGTSGTATMPFDISDYENGLLIGSIPSGSGITYLGVSVLGVSPISSNQLNAIGGSITFTSTLIDSSVVLSNLYPDDYIISWGTGGNPAVSGLVVSMAFIGTPRR